MSALISRPRAWAARIVALAAALSLLSACGGSNDDPFAYESQAQFAIRQLSTARVGSARISRLEYESPKNGWVPALLVVPRKPGPHAGLIVQHGLPGRNEDMLSAAREFAELGYVVVAIDAPFARRAGEPLRFDDRDRDEQVQLITDLRRAVDLLQRRADVDPDRIGYLGYSYGAAMGGLLAGAEHRIRAFVLMVGDGGIVEHFTGPGQGGPLSSLPAEQREQWLAAMRPVEPLTWVKKAQSPLLLLSGRRDQLVTTDDARRYHRAAPEPKDIRWYDSDHFLPPEAWCDGARFLARYLGGDGGRHPACSGRT